MLNAYRLDKCLDMEYLPRKIVFMGQETAADPVIIRRHNLDINDHVNNAQYVDIALDLLPGDLKPSRILASYHISAVDGDTLFPYIHKEDDGFGVDLRLESGETCCKVKVICD